MFNKKNEKEIKINLNSNNLHEIMMGVSFEKSGVSAEELIQSYEGARKDQEDNKLAKKMTDKRKDLRDMTVFMDLIRAISHTDRFEKETKTRVKLLNYLEELIEKAK